MVFFWGDAKNIPLRGGGWGQVRSDQHLRAGEVLLQRVHRGLAAARHVGLFKIAVHVLGQAGHHIEPHLLREHVGALLQLVGGLFADDVLLGGGLHHTEPPEAADGENGE